MSKSSRETKIANRIERKFSIPISGSSLTLPCFFPSISSVKTNLPILEYLRILISIQHPLFLISAYDIYNCSNNREHIKINNILRDSVRDGKAVIIDSGNYEGYWIKDKSWDKTRFWSCLKNCDYGFAFHFDKRLQKIKFKSRESIIDEIERSVVQDQRKALKGTIIPIIHSPSEFLPEIAVAVANRLNPVMIAIPERELGEGIIARSSTLAKIRKALDENGLYYPIHLLGTGNPLSMLIFVMCGADSFDGLEWCQTTVNFENALLYHFQQRELFGYQTEFDSLDIPYTQVTLAHNLEFYRLWMNKIQSCCSSGSIVELAQDYLSKEFIEVLIQVLSEV